LKKLFDLGIGCNEETGTYFAIINSLTDNKTARVADPNLRVVLGKLSKMIRKKVNDINCFPIEKPDRIIQFNGNGAAKKLIVAR
jgi:hypothetical protein